MTGTMTAAAAAMTGTTTAAAAAMTGTTGVVAGPGCSGNRELDDQRGPRCGMGLPVLVRRGSDGVRGGPSGTGSRRERIDRDRPGGAGAGFTP